MDDYPYDAAAYQLELEHQALEEASYYTAIGTVHDWLQMRHPEMAESVTDLLKDLAA